MVSQLKLEVLPEVLREQIGTLTLAYIKTVTGIELDNPNSPAYAEPEVENPKDADVSWTKFFESLDDETREVLLPYQEDDLAQLGRFLDALVRIDDLVSGMRDIKLVGARPLFEVSDKVTRTRYVETTVKGKKTTKAESYEKYASTEDKQIEAIRKALPWLRLGVHLIYSASHTGLLRDWEDTVNFCEHTLPKEATEITTWFQGATSVLGLLCEQMRKEDPDTYKSMSIAGMADHLKVERLVGDWLIAHEAARENIAAVAAKFRMADRELQLKKMELAEAKDLLEARRQQSDSEFKQKFAELQIQADIAAADLARVTSERDDLVKRAQAFDLDNTQAQRRVVELEARNTDLQQQAEKLLAQIGKQKATSSGDSEDLLFLRTSFEQLASTFGVKVDLTGDWKTAVKNTLASLEDL